MSVQPDRLHGVAYVPPSSPANDAAPDRPQISGLGGPGAHFVPRNRISARLEQIDHARAAEVTGSAGSGKTTVLKAWSASTEVGVVAWLTAQSRHRDALVLARAIADAVWHAAELEHDSPGAEPTGIVDGLADAVDRSGRRVIMVIDDAEKLGNAQSLGVIRRLVSKVQDSLRVVVAGRAIPDVGFSELRHRGELVTIAANDLRLAAGETSQIVRTVSRSQVDDEDLLAIHRQIDGWALGAVLAGLALNGSQVPALTAQQGIDSHRLFDQFFATEVFNVLPVDLQTFLLDTCVLDLLEPALCTELTGRADAEPVLRSLERANMFTEWLGGRPPVYRYHAVLRSWLRARLGQTQPGRKAELLRRAAIWCESHGRVADAIDYRLAADDHAAASRLITAHGPRVLGEGRYEAMRTWIGALPKGLVASNVPLLILMADAEHRLGNAEAATAARALTRDLLTQRPESPLSAHHELTVMVQQGTELHRRGHLLAAAAQARRCIPMIDLSRPTTGADTLQFEDLVLAMNVASIASQLMFAGHWAECRRLSKWVVDSFPADDPNVATARARSLGQQAVAELLDGSRMAAETLANEAVALCRFYELEPLDIGYAEMALLVAGRNIDRASLHATLEQRAAQLDMASHTCLVGLLRAWAYVQTGDLEDAGRALAVAEQAMSLVGEPGVLVAVTERVRSIVEAGTDEPFLRPRELQVLLFLASGKSRREVAEQLHLSLNTVKTYARLAYRALDVNTLDDAVARCEALGIRLEPRISA